MKIRNIGNSHLVLGSPQSETQIIQHHSNLLEDLPSQLGRMRQRHGNRAVKTPMAGFRRDPCRLQKMPPGWKFGLKTSWLNFSFLGPKPLRSFHVVFSLLSSEINKIHAPMIPYVYIELHGPCTTVICLFSFA